MKPTVCSDDWKEYSDPLEIPPVKSEEFAPVSHEVLSQILSVCGLDTSGKVRIVDIVQTNNKNKVGSYTIELQPGKTLKIENGKVVQ
jgi:hypothetical protein